MPPPQLPPTTSSSSSTVHVNSNGSALPDITPSIVNNFKSAIIYVYGILYSSELSKSVQKIEIIVILIILFITLIFILHWIKSITKLNTPPVSSTKSKHLKNDTPYVTTPTSTMRYGFSAELPSLFTPQIMNSPYFAPARWRLWWQFLGEIIEFLIQYIGLLFVGAIRDVLVDTSLVGPWVELILLRPLLFVSALIAVKILILYLHNGSNGNGTSQAGENV